MAYRFIILGSMNTALTYSFFIGLSFLIAPALAYTIAFASGLFMITFKSNKLVFRGKDSWPRRLTFLACYLFIFLFGQVLIALTKPATLLELVITSGAIMAFSIPVIVLCGRRTFRPIALTK